MRISDPCAPRVTVVKLRKPEPLRSIHAAVREATLGQPALGALLDALRVCSRPPR